MNSKTYSYNAKNAQEREKKYCFMIYFRIKLVKIECVHMDTVEFAGFCIQDWIIKSILGRLIYNLLA